MPQKLKFLVIHCTATPEGRLVYPDHIRNWHTWPREGKDGKLMYMGDLYSTDELLPREVRYKRGRGWRQVGYADMILLNGTLVNLVSYDDDDEVDAWEVTNGVAGINGKSRHVVYVGGTDDKGKTKDTRNEQQLHALTNYIRSTIKKHPDIQVAGHNQFAAKDCPSFDVPEWLRSIGVREQNIHDPKRPAAVAPMGTTVLVLLLALLLGGCVSFKKCQEKFAQDTVRVVIRDTVDVTVSAPLPADSVEGSISADTLALLMTGKLDSLVYLSESKDVTTKFWKDKYTNALRHKSKVERDTLIITKRVPVEVIGDCPPVMVQPAPKGLEKLWKGYQLFSGYLVLAAIFVLLFIKLLRRI